MKHKKSLLKTILNTSCKLKPCGLYAIIQNGRIGTLLWIKEYDTKIANSFVFFPDPNESACYTFMMKRQDVTKSLKSGAMELIEIVPKLVYEIYKTNWVNAVPLKDTYKEEDENEDKASNN